MINVVIILVLLFSALYFTSKLREDDDAPFWKKLLEAISLKVVDFYFAATPTKLVAIFLRGIFGMYAIAALSYPTIKLFRSTNDNESFWDVLISWDEVSTKITCLFVVSATLVIVLYLILHRHEAKTTKAVMETDERTKVIEQQNQTILQKSDEILSYLQSNENRVIKNFLPLTVDNIKRLKLKTAYDYLIEMKKEVEVSEKNDKMLKANILYWMGCCSRYIGESERSISEMTESYKLMKEAGETDSNIIGGMIYVYCRKDNEQEAQRLGEKLRKIDVKNVWGWMPLFHFQDDLNVAYNGLETQTENAKLVLANELMIRQKEGAIPEKIVDLLQLDEIDITELSYDNLPIWVLIMSVALTRFIRNWKFVPEGKSLSTKESEELFMLTDVYLKKLEDTEIKNLLPDTEYIHIVTGFCHDKKMHWIDEMKKASYSAGHKEVFVLSYAMMLMESDRKNEALKTLQVYGDDVTISILNCRMHVALDLGDFDDVAKVFEIAAEKKIAIEDGYINYFVSFARWNFDKVKESTAKLCFANPLSKRVYDELMNLWAGKSVDLDFLLENESKMCPLFKPYVALAYQKFVSLDKAIETAKSCLPPKGVDLRNYIYIELLESDILLTKELYHYLNTLREDGYIEDDRLLEKEMWLAEKIEDYEVVVETSSILLSRHPEEMSYIEHYIIALNKIGGHKDKILKLIPNIEKLKLAESQVHNVFTVLHLEGLIEEALEFLYQQIQKNSTRTLRDEYFIACLQKDFSEIIHKQEETVKDGSYILYNDGNEDKYDIVLKGSTLDEFIGMRPGDSMEWNQVGNEKKLILKGVYNKYMKLANEIGDEIKANKSRSIVSINATEEYFAKDPIGLLNQIAGFTSEQKQAQESDLRNYQDGKLSLMAFVKKEHIICNCYDLLFNDFVIKSIPDGEIKNVCDKYQIDFSKLDLVLDLSSLIMLYEMNQLFGLKLENKLIIPKGIIQQIDDDIIYEQRMMPANFGGRGIERLVKITPAEGETYYSGKLKDLKEWAEKHCVVMVAEEKLNMDMSKINSVITSLEVESMILANKVGRAFLTEDWSLCITLGGVFPSLSVSNLLFVTNNEKYREVSDFLTSVNRIGQMVSEEYIYQQCENMCNGKDNYWRQCLNNIENNPQSYISAIKAAIRISEGIITNGKTEALNSLLVIMFKAMPVNLVLKVYQSAYAKSSIPVYRMALTNALKSVHPEYFARS